MIGLVHCIHSYIVQISRPARLFSKKKSDVIVPREILNVLIEIEDRTKYVPSKSEGHFIEIPTEEAGSSVSRACFSGLRSLVTVT